MLDTSAWDRVGTTLLGDPHAGYPGAMQPRGSPAVQLCWEQAGCQEAGDQTAPGEVPAWGKQDLQGRVLRDVPGLVPGPSGGSGSPQGPPWHQPCAIAPLEAGAGRGVPEGVGTVTQEGRSGRQPMRVAPSTSPVILLRAGHCAVVTSPWW